VPKPTWPQPFPYKTNLEKAKELVAAAGGGFSTTLQFDAGNATVAEPMSVLIKEALGAIGINVEISKVPGANFRTEIAKKINPMTLNRFAGWLDYPDYYLFWTMHGNNSIFNIANYQNPELDKLIDAARFAGDKADYEKTVVEFIKLVNREVPMIPISQPTHDVAMQKSIGGYQFQPCREPDFRYLTKA
jgi:peptide/nickel transport system substrate-binding protein